MESSTERLEEVLQQVQGELSNAVDKLDDIKMEVSILSKTGLRHPCLLFYLSLV